MMYPCGSLAVTVTLKFLGRYISNTGENFASLLGRLLRLCLRLCLRACDFPSRYLARATALHCAMRRGQVCPGAVQGIRGQA